MAKKTAMQKMMEKAKEAKKAAKASAPGFPYLSIAEPGIYRIRVMTPNDNYPIFTPYAMHYFVYPARKGVDAIECPAVAEDPCPVCELRDALPFSKNRNTAEKELFSALYASKRYAFLVLHRNAENDPNTLRILRLNQTAGLGLLKLLHDPEAEEDDYSMAEDVLDPAAGLDFIIEVTEVPDTRRGGTTKQIEINYPAAEMIKGAGGTPVVADEEGKLDKVAYQALLDTKVPWDELVEVKSYNECNEILQTNLGLIGIDIDEIRVDGQQVETATVEAAVEPASTEDVQKAIKKKRGRPKKKVAEVPTPPAKAATTPPPAPSEPEKVVEEPAAEEPVAAETEEVPEVQEEVVETGEEVQESAIDKLRAQLAAKKAAAEAANSA